jgi:cobalt/nickel transport system ATP-binding protein
VVVNAVSIDVRDVTYRYPSAHVDALDRLTMHVGAGERVAVLGPNGSGKTTLVLHLIGLLQLQSGSITVGDTPMSEATLREIRRRVGCVFQDPDDQLFMQEVREDVAFGPANLGVTGAELDTTVDVALRSVGAEDLATRTPHHLSGGEKRRVAIATVLAMHPHALVLDEPTSGLDPVGRRELAELLDTLDHTQVIVTHDLPFALATCPRSLVIDGGRVVVDAPTAELFGDEPLLGAHRLELPFGFRPTADPPSG